MYNFQVFDSFCKGRPRRTCNEEIRSNLEERKDSKVLTKHRNALEVIHKKCSWKMNIKTNVKTNVMMMELHKGKRKKPSHTIST